MGLTVTGFSDTDKIHTINTIYTNTVKTNTVLYQYRQMSLRSLTAMPSAKANFFLKRGAERKSWQARVHYLWYNISGQGSVVSDQWKSIERRTQGEQSVWGTKACPGWGRGTEPPRSVEGVPLAREVLVHKQYSLRNIYEKRTGTKRS